MVKIVKRELKVAVNLIDWSAQAPSGQLRPQIESRPGTKVRIRTEEVPEGTVCTCYVRRRGRHWSNTVLVRKDGSTVRCWQPILYHGKIRNGE